jgi:hypothetical protein
MSLGQGLVRPAFAADAAYTRASRELDLTSQEAQLLCAVGLHPGPARPLVDLTEEGRRCVESFVAILAETIDPLFAAWPPAEQAEAQAVLNRLAGTLEAAV